MAVIIRQVAKQLQRGFEANHPYHPYHAAWRLFRATLAVDLRIVTYNNTYNSYFCTKLAVDAISYTAARANLAKTMDRVNENHEAIIITRQNGSPAVLMSLKHFNAWQETAYLLRSPANARRLLKAALEIKQGKAKPRKLMRDK